MEPTRVQDRATATLSVVEGDLHVGNRALIRAAQGNLVLVKGRAEFDGGGEVDCDFECESLESREGLVRINGNLMVHEKADVEEALYTLGNMRAKQIDVGGRLSVGASLETQTADIGGSLEVQGNLSADSVEVGGALEARGELKLQDLEVGGSVDVGGGAVTGKIEVGGRFLSRKELRFQSIETGGSIELAGGAGARIEVGGRLTSKGDLVCEGIEVGGVIEVEGSLSGKDAEIGGRIRVSKDLTMTTNLEVGGVAEVGGTLSGGDADVRGRLIAGKGMLSGGFTIAGTLETREGLKARTIEIGKEVRCRGALVGETVNLARHAIAQDVYCTHLLVEGGSKLGKVFAETVELGDTCIVEKVVYTNELREGQRVVHLNPPQKVDSLPPFPL